MIGRLRRAAKLAVRPAQRVLPLGARRRYVRWLGRHPRIPYRQRLSIELLRDYLETAPNEAHRFLWAHHLAYARIYEVDQKFGAERIKPSRRMLFEDLRQYLEATGVDPATDVHSVFEVGCSLGYLLRHLETTMFTGATSIEGVDIDRYAIEQGNRHLAAAGSSIRLRTADVADVDLLLDRQTIDVILCAGVLLYLPEADAAQVVSSIVRHVGTVAVFSGPAHPDRDNGTLDASTRREGDATFVHNIDRMVVAAGGTVAWRRYEGSKQFGGNTIYFVLATGARSGALGRGAREADRLNDVVSNDPE